MSSANTRHAVLDYYYSNVVSLQEYLISCLPAERAHQLLDRVIDTPSYTTLLQGTYVAWSTPEGAPRPFPSSNESLGPLEQITRRAQRDLLSSATRPDNVLCYGFVQNNGSVVNKYSNTSLTAFQESKDWKLILNR